MKNLFFLLFLLPLSVIAQDNKFVISGNISGLPDGEVKIVTTNQDNTLVSTARSTNGTFSLTSSVPEPALYSLVIGKQKPVFIFLENTPIKITGSYNDLSHLNIEGSQSHNDFMDFNQRFNPLLESLNKIATQIQNATNEKKRDLLVKQYDSVSRMISEGVGSFVSSKRSSYVSPFVLFITAQLNENPFLLEQRYNMLDSSIRNSHIGNSLAEYINYSKVGSVGTDALDFTQNNPDGKPLTLSSFKGKYVLVDFWASWCRPCRAENPNVVKAYQKFKNKNFTILSVSLDQEKQSWMNAIQKDGLNWNHVSDLQYWKNSVAVLYHVQSIPQNFLVDPNGKIIAKDLRGEDLEKKLCELIGCN